MRNHTPISGGHGHIFASLTVCQACVTRLASAIAVCWWGNSSKYGKEDLWEGGWIILRPTRLSQGETLDECVAGTLGCKQVVRWWAI